MDDCNAAAFDVRRSAAGFCRSNKKIQADSLIFALF
jgi:hypothetical protein